MSSFSAQSGHSAYASVAHPVHDSRHLRQIFERRAARFDEVAFLPREIAARMRERLDYIRLAPARVLDAGCGPGDDLPKLRARFPDAAVFGADIASAMLARAARGDGSGGHHDHGDGSDNGKSRAENSSESRNENRDKNHGGNQDKTGDAPPTPDARWRRLLPASMGRALRGLHGMYGLRSMRGKTRSPLAQADFAALPFASGAFDLLWSNLALHWHPRPDVVLGEWQRVLKANGLLMFSTPGPDTLKELRAAYREIETAHGAPPRARVIDFADMHDLGDLLVENGFELPVMDQETLTVTYRTPASLLADVRRWGAYPFARAGADTLAAHGARRLHDALVAALEARRRDDGTIALTFEIVYGHAWKAQPRKTPDGQHIVRIEDIGRGSVRNR